MGSRAVHVLVSRWSGAGLARRRAAESYAGVESAARAGCAGFRCVLHGARGAQSAGCVAREVRLGIKNMAGTKRLSAP